VLLLDRSLLRLLAECTVMLSASRGLSKLQATVCVSVLLEATALAAGCNLVGLG
jgi:hypothetical protein